MISPKDPPIITFYNFKGGIGKTTSVQALSWVLAEDVESELSLFTNSQSSDSVEDIQALGKSLAQGLPDDENSCVLIIDADAQANLTFAFLRANAYHQFSHSPASQNKPNVEDLNESVEDLNESVDVNIKVQLDESVKEEMKRIMADDRQDESLDKLNFYQCLRGKLDKNKREDLNKIDLEHAKDVQLITSKLNPRLKLLPGSINTGRLERHVAMALWKAAGASDDILVKIMSFIRAVARQHNARIILVDLNPSISALNETILMGCDYFMIPAQPDLYSKQAIDSLVELLPEWISETDPLRRKDEIRQLEEAIKKVQADESITQKQREETIQRRKQQLDNTLSFPQSRPKLLGLLVQRYNVIERGIASKAGEDWIKELTQAFERPGGLKELLEKNQMISSISAKNMPNNRIEDFRGIGLAASKIGYPITAVVGKHPNDQKVHLKTNEYIKKILVTYPKFLEDLFITPHDEMMRLKNFEKFPKQLKSFFTEEQKIEKDNPAFKKLPDYLKQALLAKVSCDFYHTLPRGLRDLLTDDYHNSKKVKKSRKVSESKAILIERNYREVAHLIMLAVNETRLLLVPDDYLAATFDVKTSITGENVKHGKNNKCKKYTAEYAGKAIELLQTHYIADSQVAAPFAIEQSGGVEKFVEWLLQKVEQEDEEIRADLAEEIFEQLQNAKDLADFKDVLLAPDTSVSTVLQAYKEYQDKFNDFLDNIPINPRLRLEQYGLTSWENRACLLNRLPSLGLDNDFFIRLQSLCQEVNRSNAQVFNFLLDKKVLKEFIEKRIQTGHYDTLENIQATNRDKPLKILKLMGDFVKAQAHLVVWKKKGGSDNLIFLWDNEKNEGATHHLLYDRAGKRYSLLAEKSLTINSRKQQAPVDTEIATSLSLTPENNHTRNYSLDQVTYQVVPNDGRGNNCFFYAIGTTRREFADKVLEAAQKSLKTRQALADYIYENFEDSLDKRFENKHYGELNKFKATLKKAEDTWQELLCEMRMTYRPQLENKIEIDDDGATNIDLMRERIGQLADDVLIKPGLQNRVLCNIQKRETVFAQIRDYFGEMTRLMDFIDLQIRRSTWMVEVNNDGSNQILEAYLSHTQTHLIVYHVRNRQDELTGHQVIEEVYNHHLPGEQEPIRVFHNPSCWHYEALKPALALQHNVEMDSFSSDSEEGMILSGLGKRARVENEEEANEETMQKSQKIIEGQVATQLFRQGRFFPSLPAEQVGSEGSDQVNARFS